MYKIVFAICLVTFGLGCKADQQQIEALEKERANLKRQVESTIEECMDLRGAIVATLRKESQAGDSSRAFMRRQVGELSWQYGIPAGHIRGSMEILWGMGDADLEGKLQHPTESKTNRSYWLGNENANGGRGDGTAIQLREVLREYQAHANDVVTKHQLKTGAEVPLFPELAGDLPGKAWEVESFQGKTILENLVFLNRLQLQVAEMYAALLQLVETRLGNQGARHSIP